MPHRFNVLRTGVLAVIVLLFGHQAAFAQTPDQVIRRVQDKYNGVQALRAEFTQTMSSAYSDEAQSYSGTIYLQGDKYRVEAGRQTFVTDGAVTWIYNADENQVLVNSNVEDETSFSLNDFLFNLQDDYTATEARRVNLAGQQHFMLKLKPRQTDSFFSDVTVWLRDSDTVVTRLEVVDANMTTMTFDLKNVQLNPAINAGTFTFRPPQNAEVVDLRS